MGTQLLLLSTSTLYGQQFLEYALSEIAEFLSGCQVVYFVPYAQADYEGYTARVEQALAPLGIKVVGLHTTPEPHKALQEAEALFVGGGNSFRLLKALQTEGLVEAVRTRVKAGQLRYLGASAGTNLACPTLRTTNDMPILRRLRAPHHYIGAGRQRRQRHDHFFGVRRANVIIAVIHLTIGGIYHNCPLG